MIIGRFVLFDGLIVTRFYSKFGVVWNWVVVLVDGLSGALLLLA